MPKQTSTPVLLNYNITSEPSPLQISTDGYQAYGILNLVVSVPANQTVYCKEIDIYIPSKLLSQSDTFNPALNTDKWQYAIGAKVDGGDIGLEVGISYVPVKFLATSSQYYLINYPLLLTLGVGQVTTAIGDVKGLHVVEYSSATESGDYTQRDLEFSVTVGAAQFYVRNFVASLYDSAKPDTVPGGSFTNGQAIKLSWEGNASEYQVVTTAGSTPVYTGQDNSLVLPNGLKQTTTFILIASQTDSTRSETLYLYETVTVVITNPDETPNTVTAAGSIATTAGLSSQTLNVAGAATLGGDTGVGGKLDVTGDTVLGNARIDNALSVFGPTSLIDARVNGSLTVGGASTLADTIVKGALSTFGSVGMLGAAQYIGTGSFRANTDGYLIGTVSLGWQGTKLSVAWIYGGVNNYNVCATGGNVGSFNSSWTKYCTSNFNSFTLPVPKGSTFWTRTDFFHENQVNPSATYIWIPIGSNAGEASFEKISDDLPDNVPPIMGGAELKPDATDVFASLLEDVIGKPIPADKKDAFVKALRGL